jgi:hypothetical protein
MKETTIKAFSCDTLTRTIDAVTNEMEQAGWRKVSRQFYMTVVTFEREKPDQPEPQAVQRSATNAPGQSLPDSGIPKRGKQYANSYRCPAGDD